MVPTMCVISIIPPGGHSYKMAHLRSLWQQQHSEGGKKKKKKKLTTWSFLCPWVWYGYDFSDEKSRETAPTLLVPMPLGLWSFVLFFSAVSGLISRLK